MSGMEAVFSAAVGRHGGVRLGGQREGGSFLAAFAGASEALACALDVQRELQANQLSWLRAGLHTGEAQVSDEVRYFGQAVARTERLRDLGHGGQVLVSRASADLVADRLPAGASLTDVGPTVCTTCRVLSRSTSCATPTSAPTSRLSVPSTATPTTSRCS